VGKAPAWIGLCPNRVGEAKYVVAGYFFDFIEGEGYDDGLKAPICEHCGEPLILYERVRTSLMAVDG
jgi:hypothetical protein